MVHSQMSLKSAIVRILSQSDEPLHYREIVKRILEQGLWSTTGRTPDATVSATISQNPELFLKASPGVFGLAPSSTSVAANLSTQRKPPSTSPKMTYLEAAEIILRRQENEAGLHYTSLTEVAINESLINPSGLTPEATMNAQLSSDIQKRLVQGRPPRFRRVKRGVFAIGTLEKPALTQQIESHNNSIRRELHKRLMELEPKEFERLISTLLSKLGYRDTEVTKLSGDGGVDVRGTLVVADVIETKMAIQVKRWSQNVQSTVVQNLRGSIGAHEQGLIVTTSSFSKGARAEAERPDRERVSLMDGEALLDQFIEYSIGVNRDPVTILYISDVADANEELE